MPLATILVEDSASIRKSLIPALVEFADAEIIAVAGTAGEALAAMNQHHARWRLAVVDLFLQEGNGLDVVRAAQGRSRHQWVIVLTNYATADIRRRATDLGADAIFDKSTELDDFLSFCGSLKSGAREP